MSVELLKAAAGRIRQHVADLPVRVQADWEQDSSDIYAGPMREWVGETFADVSSYIALMHPPVALALAHWLEEASHDAWDMGSGSAALAVARAILREES